MAIKFQNLVVSFKDGKERRVVLNDLTLTVESGSAVAIMGPSGSGKTTLLKVANGQHMPDTGQVLTSPGDARVSAISQNLDLVPFLTAAENVALAAELSGTDLADGSVERLLESFGVGQLAGNQPSSLSQGEQQRVAIARALATRCDILLADEPTAALDADNARIVARHLRAVAHQHGATVIVATHDPIVAEAMDAVYLLELGVLNTSKVHSVGANS